MKKFERFSARQKTEVVLRLLRGEALDLLSRELGLPAARLATWREVCLDAGQEALKKPPLDSRDQEIGRLALHWPVVWPGACLPRVGCGPLHHLLATTRALCAWRPAGARWSLCR